MHNPIYPHISKRKAYVAWSPKSNTTEQMSKKIDEPTDRLQKPGDKKKKMLAGLKPSLLTLTIGGFSIGMTEFMMMGVLPDVASDLGVNIPAAGHLIAIYALGVVIGAPLMVALAGNYPPRKVLISLMAMFAVFN